MTHRVGGIVLAQMPESCKGVFNSRGNGTGDFVVTACSDPGVVAANRNQRRRDVFDCLFPALSVLGGVDLYLTDELAGVEIVWTRHEICKSI